ncbi:MAG: carboxylating nicotinate-nucleotide diphosphorylase [Deltaproteobacteria bacterium]|nr:carboxylating nicotinate-nucleotide diphosphorylase [Deltaproteobacteria bacterium]
MLSTDLEILIRTALEEDIGSGDITTSCIVEPEAQGKGRIVAKEPLVLAGIDVARQVFWAVDKELKVHLPLKDGSRASEGDLLLEVAGRLAAILMAERTALNFLQRLSGIATLTRAFVDKTGGTRARILDTRKTTPGYRFLEKAAVRVGGGYNHRFGLYDGVLIKDNHIAAAGSIHKAVQAALNSTAHTLRVEVEVETLDQLAEAIAAGAHAVMLDNMDLETMAEAVRRTKGKVPLEASGGITLENVGEIATTGVDLISVGALTHSARAVDMSMDIEPA